MSKVAKRLFPCDIEKAVDEWFDTNVPRAVKRKSPDVRVEPRYISCVYCEKSSTVPIGKKDPNGRFRLVSFDKQVLDFAGVAHRADDFTNCPTVSHFLCRTCDVKMDSKVGFCIDVGARLKSLSK